MLSTKKATATEILDIAKLFIAVVDVLLMYSLAQMQNQLWKYFEMLVAIRGCPRPGFICWMARLLGLFC